MSRVRVGRIQAGESAKENRCNILGTFLVGSIYLQPTCNLVGNRVWKSQIEERQVAGGYFAMALMEFQELGYGVDGNKVVSRI